MCHHVSQQPKSLRLKQGESGSGTAHGDPNPACRLEKNPLAGLEAERRWGPSAQNRNPVKTAIEWQNAGAEWVHLVDLDTAFGRGTNAELLHQGSGEADDHATAVWCGVSDLFNVDRSVVEFDDPTDNGEAEPGSSVAA
jgi:Histidine biosynthesis protein